MKGIHFPVLFVCVVIFKDTTSGYLWEISTLQGNEDYANSICGGEATIHGDITNATVPFKENGIDAENDVWYHGYVIITENLGDLQGIHVKLDCRNIWVITKVSARQLETGNRWEFDCPMATCHLTKNPDNGYESIYFPVSSTYNELPEKGICSPTTASAFKTKTISMQQADYFIPLSRNRTLQGQMAFVTDREECALLAMSHASLTFGYYHGDVTASGLHACEFSTTGSGIPHAVDAPGTAFYLRSSFCP